MMIFLFLLIWGFVAWLSFAANWTEYANWIAGFFCLMHAIGIYGVKKDRAYLASLSDEDRAEVLHNRKIDNLRQEIDRRYRDINFAEQNGDFHKVRQYQSDIKQIESKLRQLGA